MAERDPERYLRAADRTLRETYEGPMDLATYLQALFEGSARAAHASKYLLEAIESAGTRTTVERGEEVERYRFFDDPENDGEHAVLGNTETLNAFVDDLRLAAAGRGKDERIVWLGGPTATGKSELKRCLIDGLRAYSRTPEGRRYTIEWNVTPGEAADGRGLSYGEAPGSDEDDWYESPVQAQPLSVLPAAVREEVLDALDDGDGLRTVLESDLDPFSQEAYDRLEERYRREGRTDLFSEITDGRHLRVKNYVVDVGRGIGVLHAEDSGSPTERLVGAWLPELLTELDSRGRKNPQAFSYDGVLSQGNNGLTVIEDASQHADLVQKLLNVPEEGTVKLDKGIGMDVDTQLLLISNPDLETRLNQHEERGGDDPLKALKRRLEKHTFTYLTTLSQEVQLVRRELADERGAVWEADDYEALDERVREAVTVTIRGAGRGAVTREFAPHAVEAAALYGVVTRLAADDLPSGLDLTDKALLYDRGYLRVDGERRELSAFDLDGEDGTHGIPVTYTRDTLADLLTADLDRSHPDLPVGDVVMPVDVLDAMADGLADEPVFGRSERGEFENRVVPVKEYVQERQAADVLEAMLAEHRPERETVEEYVRHAYAWVTGEQVETDRGEAVDPDPLRMKVFETDHLGAFDEDDYLGTTPTAAVESFRDEEVVTALNRQAWEQRGADFGVESIDLTEIPALREVLGEDDWRDVRRAFGDFDPTQWADPPSGTETARVKADTIDRLGDRGYSPAAAELTTRRVLDRVSHRWD